MWHARPARGWPAPPACNALRAHPLTAAVAHFLRAPPRPALAQGRVRTKTVKRSARAIVEKYYGKLTLDFDTNKRVTDEVALVPSKRMRNKIAGFVTVRTRGRTGVGDALASGMRRARGGGSGSGGGGGAGGARRATPPCPF